MKTIINNNVFHNPLHKIHNKTKEYQLLRMRKKWDMKYRNDDNVDQCL